MLKHSVIGSQRSQEGRQNWRKPTEQQSVWMKRQHLLGFRTHDKKMVSAHKSSCSWHPCLSKHMMEILKELTMNTILTSVVTKVCVYMTDHLFSNTWPSILGSTGGIYILIMSIRTSFIVAARLPGKGVCSSTAADLGRSYSFPLLSTLDEG